MAEGAEGARVALCKQVRGRQSISQNLIYERQAFLKIELIGFNPPVFVFGQPFA